MTLTRQRSLRRPVPPSSFLNRWRLLTLTQDGCGNSGFEPSSASDHDDGDDGAYAVFGLVQHDRNSRSNLDLNDDEHFFVNPRRHHPLYRIPRPDRDWYSRRRSIMVSASQA
jgi:hypothetical protein